jgi:hypothetical protein
LPDALKAVEGYVRPKKKLSDSPIGGVATNRSEGEGDQLILRETCELARLQRR